MYGVDRQISTGRADFLRFAEKRATRWPRIHADDGTTYVSRPGPKLTGAVAAAEGGGAGGLFDDGGAGQDGIGVHHLVVLADAEVQVGRGGPGVAGVTDEAEEV